MWAGITAVWSGQIISAAENLAVVPIYLSHWSGGRYGEWLALSSMANYLSTLDLGMNMAGGNRLTQEFARGDMKAYSRYQRSALAFYIAAALGGSAMLGLAVWLFPVTNILGLHEISRREASIVAVLLGLQMLWSIPAGFVSGIYRTMGDLARTQWIRNATNTTALGLSAACLLLGGGMIAMATVQLGCLGVSTIAVLLDLGRRHPAMMPGIAGASLEAVRELLRPSLLFSLMILAEAIRVQGTVLLISRHLGGSAVAVFVTSRTLCNAVRQIAGNLNTALWPHVTAFDAQRRHSTIRQFHRLWVMCSIALCISVAGALWFEGIDVMRVWTRNRLPGDTVLIRLLLAQLVLQSPWQASSLITAASSRHGKLSYAYLGSSVLAFGLAAIMIGQMGVRAVPIGSIVAEGLICYHFVTRDTCGQIEEGYRRFALHQWLFLGCASGMALAAAWGADSVAAGPAVARWIEVGVASALGCMAALWTVGFRSEDRSQLRAWMQVAGA